MYSSHMSCYALLKVHCITLLVNLFRQHVLALPKNGYIKMKSFIKLLRATLFASKVCHDHCFYTVVSCQKSNTSPPIHSNHGSHNHLDNPYILLNAKNGPNSLRNHDVLERFKG